MPIRRLLPAAAALLVLAVGAGSTAAAQNASASAPYYFSIHKPVAEPTRGIVILIHGGGWRGDLGERVEPLWEPQVRQLTRRGYIAAPIAYRSGASSLADVVAFYDRLRSRWPRRPICAEGGSAGAHLAMMLDVRRGLDCIAAVGLPPDLDRWGNRSHSDEGRELAVAAFGERRLHALSPIHRAGEGRARLLLAAPRCDIFISAKRTRALYRKLRRHDRRLSMLWLDAGSDGPWWHCQISADGAKRYERMKLRLLARAMPASQ